MLENLIDLDVALRTLDPLATGCSVVAAVEPKSVPCVHVQRDDGLIVRVDFVSEPTKTQIADATAIVKAHDADAPKIDAFAEAVDAAKTLDELKVVLKARR